VWCFLKKHTREADRLSGGPAVGLVGSMTKARDRLMLETRGEHGGVAWGSRQRHGGPCDRSQLGVTCHGAAGLLDHARRGLPGPLLPRLWQAPLRLVNWSWMACLVLLAAKVEEAQLWWSQPTINMRNDVTVTA
jgi:hypothetical protein